MSDKGSQGDSEQLFDTKDPDTSADAESTTTGQETESVGEEIKELDLETDVKKNLSKAEVERQKQVDVWYSRIASGEATLDQVPADQKWLKPLITSRLDAVSKTPDIERLVEQKLAERDDRAKFASLKETLKHTKLTALQRKELEAEYKDFRGDGVRPSKALEKAMRIVGVEFDRETAPEELRQAMRLHPTGQRLRTDSSDALTDPESFKKLPETERLKKLEELRKKGR